MNADTTAPRRPPNVSTNVAVVITDCRAGDAADAKCRLRLPPLVLGSAEQAAEHGCRVDVSK